MATSISVRTAIATIALSLGAPLTLAHAQEAPAEEALADLVNEAAPTDVPLLAGEFEAGSFEASAITTDATVSIPESAEGTIVVDVPSENSQASPAIGITLPEQVASQNGELTDSGAVVYANASSEVDVVVQPVEDGSVRINTVVHERSAPHGFTYRLSLPDSAVLIAQEDGSIAIMDGSDFLGGIAAPWAVDAVGEHVATHFQIDGQSVTQVVQPNSETQYPIVADPWLGKALVSKAVWRYKSASRGYTLEVYPTLWGRVGAYPTAAGLVPYGLLRSAFWNEVKAKAPGTREDTSSMRDQLYCHIDAVRFREPNKPSWNLDTWRPRVSYATMLARRCNP